MPKKNQKKSPNKPGVYRPGVGVLLLNEKGKVFAARRIDTRSEAWQMPQGGIDQGETPAQAVMRELMEEIGTDKVELLRESKGWFSYDLPDYLQQKLWRGRFAGQRQKWFAMRFTGKDADINIDTDHPEFCEWTWMDHHVLPDLIVSFKRQLYIDVLQEFEDIIASHTS
jgi:putative (di)nucleoside polyphosphate hydrolase